MAEQTQQLVTVAEYIKMRDIKTPQVINGYVRNQGAPAHYIEGKRMIDVDEFDQWMKERDMNKGERGGRTRSEVGQRRTNVRKGTILAHNTKAGKIIIKTVNKISEFVVWADTNKTGISARLPMKWDDLAKSLRQGEQIVLNPYIVCDLMQAHYDHALYDGQITEEQHSEITQALAHLKELTDPSAGEDSVELGDEDQQEDNDDEDDAEDNSEREDGAQ